MGGNYGVAVRCSDFSGISLGSIPITMVNVATISHRYGNSHSAKVSKINKNYKQ